MTNARITLELRTNHLKKLTGQELHEKIRKLAKTEGLSVNHWVGLILEVKVRNYDNNLP